nr:acyl carrier protein [uncultured bacterium]
MGKTMNIDDLRDILVACAGGEESAAPRGDFSGASFDELGYDSLALMETAATLERDYGVVIPEDQITDVGTPGELLALVNDRMAG